MPYKLRDGISFCLIDDRAVFLDLYNDRYFALSGSTNASFLKFMEGKALTPADHEFLAAAINQNVLIHDEAEGSPTCYQSRRPASESILDELGDFRPARTLAATGLILHARWCIKRRRLSHLVQSISNRKALCTSDADANESRLNEVATAFHRSMLLASAQDFCLARSIAMASWLLRNNLKTDLVFAVMLRPFRAHCWVERSGVVLNDTLENIRNFTPILVV